MGRRRTGPLTAAQRTKAIERFDDLLEVQRHRIERRLNQGVTRIQNEQRRCAAGDAYDDDQITIRT